MVMAITAHTGSKWPNPTNEGIRFYCFQQNYNWFFLVLGLLLDLRACEAFLMDKKNLLRGSNAIVRLNLISLDKKINE